MILSPPHMLAVWTAQYIYSLSTLVRPVRTYREDASLYVCLRTLLYLSDMYLGRLRQPILVLLAADRVPNRADDYRYTRLVTNAGCRLGEARSVVRLSGI